MLTRRILIAGVALVAAGCASGSSGTRPSSSPPASTATTASADASRPPTASASTTPARAHSNPGGLTDEQMVGQLFTAYVYGSGARTVTPGQRAANLALYEAETPAAVVSRWHLGGIVLLDHNSLDPARPNLSTGNLTSPAQIRALINGLQTVAHVDSGHPLLVAVDQEGGTVQRIKRGVTPLPSQAQMGKSGSAAVKCSYYRLGSELRRLGVNQDYAPVADVVRGSGGVIGSRSFGPDPARDAALVRAAVSGLQAAGVLATLKHWPGHGASTTDSHSALAVLPQDDATWREVDRVPFAAAKDQAAAVMVGHLALPAIDPERRPATLSPVLVRNQLRTVLGYRGLIVTDSLWMRPARDAGTPGWVALTALGAGNDVLLMSPDVPAASRALVARVRRDPATRRLVQEAAGVVLRTKQQLGQPIQEQDCPS